MPFPATRAERQATGDPRLSVAERYASKEQYLEKVREAAESLVGREYLLAEDLDILVAGASERYEVFSATVRENQAADN